MGSLYDGRTDVELPDDLLKRICAGQKESQVNISR